MEAKANNNFINNIEVIQPEILSPTKEMISIDAKEYELLKQDYITCKTTLESVLNFVITDVLRNLVNNTLKSLNKK